MLNGSVQRIYVHIWWNKDASAEDQKSQVNEIIGRHEKLLIHGDDECWVTLLLHDTRMDDFYESMKQYSTSYRTPDEDELFIADWEWESGGLVKEGE